MPRFSVIMPAHNAANRMQMPLDSIKSQHFKDYELIVVCDACTDVTEDIAKYYGAKTKCINAGKYECIKSNRWYVQQIN